MQIEIGPPGHRGVTTLMHVADYGATGQVESKRLFLLAELAGAALYLYGSVEKNKQLEQVGLIVGLGALAGSFLIG